MHCNAFAIAKEIKVFTHNDKAAALDAYVLESLNMRAYASKQGKTVLNSIIAVECGEDDARALLKKKMAL
jgi:hypothetical protein